MQLPESTPFRIVLFVCLSPFLMTLLPLVVLAAPALLTVYVAWQVFGPAPKVRYTQRSVPIGEESANSKEGVPRRNIRYKDRLIADKDGLKTIPELMRATFEKFGSHPALGERKLVKTETKEVTVKVEGKDVVKKHTIPWKTDYQWITFTEMGQRITDFGAGLLEGTQTPLAFGDKISLFAATRPEWQVCAQAAFENGLVVVTVYPSLGPDALAYSLNQTKVTHLITQVSLLDVVGKTIGQLNGHLKCIIYMDELTPTQVQKYQKDLGLELISYNAVLNAGKELAQSSRRARRSPEPNDLAVIMYTSGSTGTPKGVMMSHLNVVASCGGIGKIPPEPICERDTYIAYLPLAHVLELTAEMTVLAFGGCLGYSSPLTLRDDGCCDETGKPAGDLGKLKPTLMAAVPMIMDRLRASVQEQVAKSNFITRLLFNTAFRIKKRRYLANHPSPILDRIVFRKIAAKFGGRLRYMLCGGAPLSGETHEFINICVCAPLLMGYGLTETMSGGTITHPDDRTTGNAGAPVASCQLKLVDEPEMGYTHKDKPKPRGQIYIGGANVTLGYYEQEKLTAEAYFTDSDGVRYFATGDIGQWEEDGTLKIIDRKKDLVKLSHGEYIAVGNLESRYSHCPLVDNICVYGDSEHGAPIALVAPNHEKLLAFAKQHGNSGDIEAVCADPAIKGAVRKELLRMADQHKFEKWERIAAVQLYPEPWTPQNGLLTEAMKLKRHEVAKKFRADIERMYQSVP